MNKKRYTAYIIGAIIFVISVWMVVTYNSLVKKDEMARLQWNEVQNAYQRRLDLVPNLVNVVQGGAQYEQSVLVKLTEARAKAASINVGSDISADKYKEQTQMQNELAGAANRLMIVVENYPDLKGTEAFTGLQAQLEGTERRIKVARQDFNEAIADYNNSVRSFPAKIVAGILGFHLQEGFQSDTGTDKSIEINF